LASTINTLFDRGYVLKSPQICQSNDRHLTSEKHAQTTSSSSFPSAIPMNRITTNPDIFHGKECIRGLRYPVQTVLEWFAGGMTLDDILNDYPDLEAKDIYASLAYVARLALTNRVELLAA
jgi:uncharacterized protein (DUF433 family)